MRAVLLQYPVGSEQYESFRIIKVETGLVRLNSVFVNSLFLKLLGHSA